MRVVQSNIANNSKNWAKGGPVGIRDIPAPFGIQVLDEATGRGVPLVTLETVNNIAFVTDSNGWAALTDPGLFGNDVFFFVHSHGYTFPKDGFGFPGVRLPVTPGGHATLKVKRVNIAERICRLTGEGIYADSLLLGEPVPTQSPVLAGKVLGQDSALAVVYRGRMLWFWGDTNAIGYPLGNFRTTGAIARFPQGQTTAEHGLDYEYFTQPDGAVRAMCPSAKPGPIWIFGLTVLGTGNQETLLAHYSRMKDLGTRFEHGYVRWDDDRNDFRVIKELPLTESWRFLEGHPVRVTENGKEFLASGFCCPVVRVPARLESLLNPASFEAFTCLVKPDIVLRDTQGRPVYRWQQELPPITSEQEAKLVRQGKLHPEETHFLPMSPSGKPVSLHGGSVTWNPWRRKWILIATEMFGKESALGEIHYAEAESPVGPWNRAVKIVTHDRYTFYNPVHHPFLDTEGGRIIFFEGTYTTTFSNGAQPTPRYEYNQILYRLDLADPHLNPGRIL
jgi:hypothetical protein